MEFSSSTPIYLQLIDAIKRLIVSGKLSPGEKLPPVRDLAMLYGVNPNTMQKALSELEWEQLLYTVRTTGRYVTEDALLIQSLRQNLARQHVEKLLADLEQLGYSRPESKELLEQYMEEGEHDDVNRI